MLKYTPVTAEAALTPSSRLDQPGDRPGFLAAALAGSASVAQLLGEGAMATVFRESLVIGSWVAMWRPQEMFLYDWWPLLGERRFYEQLGRMSVRIVRLDRI